MSDFNWNDEEAVAIPETAAVAVYMSDAGYLIVRQKADFSEEKDHIVMIHPRDIELFVLAVNDAAKE
jgi:hypothetical protein